MDKLRSFGMGLLIATAAFLAAAVALGYEIVVTMSENH